MSNTLHIIGDVFSYDSSFHAYMEVENADDLDYSNETANKNVEENYDSVEEAEEKVITDALSSELAGVGSVVSWSRKKPLNDLRARSRLSVQ